jgi:Protein of unknown function (DUF3285)
MTTEATNSEHQENLDPATEITLETPSETKVVPETQVSSTATARKPDSYVKLAMRNMVRKRGKSLQHFFLSTLGLLVLFVGLAYLTR